jgi:2-amino-4-hydroxy-6-hydroxymethyldihydropteridine diphosphokinase
MPAELALIALGSNLADPLEQLRRAAVALESVGEILKRSSLYETEPVGGPEHQPKYLNAVVILRPFEAFAEPQALLRQLLTIERQQGRVRRVRWAARSLDLDLLTFGERILVSDALSLPHPRMMERGFVLAPLCEIMPDWRHPLTQESACGALMAREWSGIVRMMLEW